MLNIWKQTRRKEDAAGAAPNANGQSSSQEIVGILSNPADAMQANVPASSDVDGKDEVAQEKRPNKRRKVEGSQTTEHFGSNISATLPEVMDLDHIESSARDIGPGENHPATLEIIVMTAKKSNSTSY